MWIILGIRRQKGSRRRADSVETTEILKAFQIRKAGKSGQKKKLTEAEAGRNRILQKGRKKMSEITYAQAIKEAMSEEMRRDENVFL
ncbi:MAG: hypothetical protein K0R19_1993, partial [Bacillota bacterium]|nr:hypothetical protein [Bacillota bacterium]